MDIREDLKSIDDEQEDQQPSQLKKIVTLIGGIILILLITSYILVSYPISDIIRGQLESNPLQGNKIELDSFSIIFNEETKEQLLAMYLREQKVEFSACLMGEKQGEKYLITSLYFPEQSATFSQVSFEPCKEDTLIILHSHPYKSCLASETDLNTLRKSKENNPYMLMVVMCEPERFSVYS